MRSIPLIIAVALSVAAAGCADDSASEHAHEHDHDGGGVAMREWDGEGTPTVEVHLEGGELMIMATGFTFTGADVTEPVPGEGHAHLYVNGELLTMVYAPTYTLPELPDDAHELTVTLSTNDHLEYMLDGKPIGATVMLGDGMDHDAMGDATKIAHGVVTEVDGDLNATNSFTIRTEDGAELVFVPAEDATFHGGPISHINSHLLSGDPVMVEYREEADGTLTAITVSDH